MAMLTFSDTGQIISTNPTQTIPPIIVTPFTMLTVPAWFRAVTFLADNLASFPRSIRQDGAKAEAGSTPHPMAKLLKRRPNLYQNATTFWRTWVFHAVHRGNGLAWIERNPRTLQPIALHNMAPDDVTPFRFTPADGSGTRAFYYVRGRTPPIIAAEDMLHIMAPSYDGLAGMDTVNVHRRTIQGGAIIDQFRQKYLEKGTQISGAIEIDGHIEEPELNDLKAYLRSQFRGAAAPDDVLILTDGAKLKNTTLTPQQSQLVEMQSMTTKQISQITGVPPQFLYEFTETKYNNPFDAGQDVVRYTFRPWIEQIEDELTNKILTDAEADSGLSVVLNPDALLRGDTASQTTNVVAMVNNRIATPNEGRAILGMPPSSDAEANKLKALGDTSPGQAGQPVPGAGNTAADK